jgi:hypothetical protein
MQYLSLIYFVNQTQHVSGMFIAHHQEVFTAYIQQLVPVIRLRWLLASAERKSFEPADITRIQIYQSLYIQYLLTMSKKVLETCRVF